MTAYEIDVQNERGYPIEADRLRKAAQAVLMRHEVEDNSAMTIVITSDDEVAALNRDFRSVDAPTDVLSFPADRLPKELLDALTDDLADFDVEALDFDDFDAHELTEGTPYLGDLVIAYPYASAQAAEHGHPLPETFSLLVVHGTLHLLGYDHDTPDRRAEMWAIQETVLNALGIPLDIVPALEEGKSDEYDAD